MFLANENFPKPSVNILRGKGYPVKYILEDCPGVSDEEVIEIALKEDLIILTFDKDYGELIFRYSKANPPSVVFFREKSNSPLFPANVLLAALSSLSLEMKNAFTVIETTGIRQRFYKNE